ncbi:MAG: molybdopterin-guanine dinucleotide biosynthesis protein B [bacterium]|nr:molybdopterin-guanine dinucleotide biosynthesis protein B [bacterium]
MKVIEIIGFSDSGKTVLIESLIKHLSGRNIKVGAIKKSFHHDVEYDKEGKDTYRMEKAGALISAGFSKKRAFLAFNSPQNPFDFLKNFSNMDIVLIEGEMGLSVPKIRCIKEDEKEIQEDPLIFAYFTLAKNLSIGKIKRIYTSENLEELTDYIISIIPNMLPQLDCGKCGFDCKTLTARILMGESNEKECKVLYGTKCKVTIDGARIELMPFLDSMLENIIKGFLSPLKGYREGKIKIEIDD